MKPFAPRLSRQSRQRQEYLEARDGPSLVMRLTCAGGWCFVSSLLHIRQVMTGEARIRSNDSPSLLPSAGNKGSLPAGLNWSSSTSTFLISSSCLTSWTRSLCTDGRSFGQFFLNFKNSKFLSCWLEDPKALQRMSSGVVAGVAFPDLTSRQILIFFSGSLWICSASLFTVSESLDRSFAPSFRLIPMQNLNHNWVCFYKWQNSQKMKVRVLFRVKTFITTCLLTSQKSQIMKVKF